MELSSQRMTASRLEEVRPVLRRAMQLRDDLIQMVVHRFGCGIGFALLQGVEDALVFVERVDEALGAREQLPRAVQRIARYGDDFLHARQRNGIEQNLVERQVQRMKREARAVRHGFALLREVASER